MSDTGWQHTETELRQELRMRERILIDDVRYWRHERDRRDERGIADDHLRRSVDAYESAKRAYDEACARTHPSRGAE